LSDPERRLAVVDLGSNTFRLVVFSWRPGEWWKRTDEIYDAVRVGEGADAAGALQKKPMKRALDTIAMYAHFCRATGIEDVRAVATSAIREASNRDEFLERALLPVQVLTREEEARYGYLAAVNSTTLADGVTLDIGGGSMQLTCVRRRKAKNLQSWPLGAVRMTERFRGKKKGLRNHVQEALEDAPWLGDGGRIVGVGGAVRNLAAADQLACGLEHARVQGHVITTERLGEMIERMFDMDVEARRKIPGIKPERGDVILAAAVVIHTVLKQGGFDGIEATEAGLREGVFFEHLLGEPPLFEDVREAGVRNLAAQYHPEPEHTAHVAKLALALWDEAARAGLHDGDPDERRLLSAAAQLHDIGTAIDYDDHHKHSRYLILNAGLPGFSPRETMLIAQMARYHRKGSPSLGEFEAAARKGDDKLLARCSAVLRVAEQLERARDQSVRSTELKVDDGRVELRLDVSDDASVARWAAQRQADVFKRAFGKELEVVE
jgi:exopolyphosphatase / guanosine-5'-triphosphate,3'-diphosphate pyrophosphatase